MLDVDADVGQRCHAVGRVHRAGDAPAGLKDDRDADGSGANDGQALGIVFIELPVVPLVGPGVGCVDRKRVVVVGKAAQVETAVAEDIGVAILLLVGIWRTRPNAINPGRRNAIIFKDEALNDAIGRRGNFSGSGLVADNFHITHEGGIANGGGIHVIDHAFTRGQQERTVRAIILAVQPEEIEKITHGGRAGIGEDERGGKSLGVASGAMQRL